MTENTDADWNVIAKENPYWGVLSDERFRGTNLPTEEKERFFNSGTSYIERVFSTVHKYITEEFNPSRALDFGCGVGRLLIPLARRCREVVGVDVAPEMLSIATKHASEEGLSNISLVQGDDHLSRINGSFDFVNCYIVLQHIPPERGYRLIGKLLSSLSVGGVFSIQVTYAKDGSLFKHSERRFAAFREMDGTIVSVQEQNLSLPEGSIRMFDYDLNRVMLEISRCAGAPSLVLPTNHSGHYGVHLIGKRSK